MEGEGGGRRILVMLLWAFIFVFPCCGVKIVSLAVGRVLLVVCSEVFFRFWYSSKSFSVCRWKSRRSVSIIVVLIDEDNFFVI